MLVRQLDVAPGAGAVRHLARQTEVAQFRREALVEEDVGAVERGS